MIQKFCTALFALAVLLSGCTKNDVTQDDPTAQICDNLKTVKAKPVVALTKGGTIVLRADSLQGAYYHWSGPSFFSSNSQVDSITSAGFFNEGWYHLNVTHPDCNDPKYDSVFVDVKFPQGTPPCTVANNAATFSNLPDRTYSFVSRGVVLGTLEITANGSGSDMRVLFNNYWNTREPEDGVYETAGTIGNESQGIDKVSIVTVASSIFFTSAAGTKVYVSHVAGKLQVNFCNLSFSGSLGGPSYTTVVSARLTAQ